MLTGQQQQQIKTMNARAQNVTMGAMMIAVLLPLLLDVVPPPLQAEVAPAGLVVTPGAAVLG